MAKNPEEQVGFLTGLNAFHSQTEVHGDESDPELAPKGPFTSKKAIAQVTVRCPLSGNPSPVLSFIALIYGFLPFIIPFAFFVDWIVTRHFITLYGLLVSIITSIINEVIFKPILDDPRPFESANKVQDKVTKTWKMKPGMPSGHVLNAMTILVWATLEVALRGPGLENPIAVAEWMTAIFVLMAPVPWARYYNKDHSLNQCLVAGGLGIVVGTLAYVFRAVFFHHAGPKPWVPEVNYPEPNKTMSLGFLGNHTFGVPLRFGA